MAYIKPFIFFFPEEICMSSFNTLAYALSALVLPLKGIELKLDLLTDV